jgi:hypothetical protein
MMTPGQRQSAPPQGRGPPSVRLVSPNRAAIERRRIQASHTKQISNRLVLVVMLATSAFALFDLLLLITHLHH